MNIGLYNGNYDTEISLSLEHKNGYNFYETSLQIVQFCPRKKIFLPVCPL